MDGSMSNVDVRKRLRILKRGIDRFFSEGYVRWSKNDLQKTLGFDLDVDDDRITFTLLAWQDAGIINLVSSEECILEILKPFPMTD